MMRPLLGRDAVAERLRPFFDLPSVRLVVLFGSCARGQTHPESDIDLAIEMDSPFDAVDLQGRLVDLLGDDRVDVVDLRRADPVLAYQISRGIPLWESPTGRFREYALLAWKIRLDYEPYMEIERRSNRERARRLVER